MFITVPQVKFPGLRHIFYMPLLSLHLFQAGLEVCNINCFTVYIYEYLSSQKSRDVTQKCRPYCVIINARILRNQHISCGRCVVLPFKAEAVQSCKMFGCVKSSFHTKQIYGRHWHQASLQIIHLSGSSDMASLGNNAKENKNTTSSVFGFIGNQGHWKNIKSRMDLSSLIIITLAPLSFLYLRRLVNFRFSKNLQTRGPGALAKSLN